MHTVCPTRHLWARRKFESFVRMISKARYNANGTLTLLRSCRKIQILSECANCVTWKRKEKENEWLKSACEIIKLFEWKRHYNVIVLHHDFYYDNSNHLYLLTLKNAAYPEVRTWKLVVTIMRVIAAIYYGIQGVKICGKLYEKCTVLDTQFAVLCNRIVHIGNMPVYFRCAVVSFKCYSWW
jgi:hypothetical protein